MENFEVAKKKYGVLSKKGNKAPVVDDEMKAVKIIKEQNSEIERLAQDQNVDAP